MRSRGDLRDYLLGLEGPVRQQALPKLTEQERADFRYDWEVWARAEQVTPAGDWSTWLICAGRGFGKTRAGAEWVRFRLRSTNPKTTSGPQRA